MVVVVILVLMVWLVRAHSEEVQGESKKSVLSNQLEKATGPYLTLSDLTGPYWALLGLTGPYWALLAYLLNLHTH